MLGTTLRLVRCEGGGAILTAVGNAGDYNYEVLALHVWGEEKALERAFLTIDIQVMSNLSLSYNRHQAQVLPGVLP